MRVNAEILKVKRISDSKEFELNDPVNVDGLFQGNIVCFGQFEDGLRVVVDDGSEFIDEDNCGTSYYSIDELENVC